MAQLHFEIEINRPAAPIFARLADLPHYGDWLPTSRIYNAVTGISDDPIRAGTTYRDQGRASLMEGQVIVFEPPHRLTFRQTSISRLGRLTVEISYNLVEQGAKTQLTRDVKLETGGLFRLLQPVLVPSLKPENRRILAALKASLKA